MAAQKAFPAPESVISPPTPEPGPRLRLRRFILAALLFLLALAISVGVLLYSPPVTESLSAIIMRPQPGTIQWNGRDQITVVAMGLTQRTTEPARTDTLMVMGIDPTTHHINMLSVPRDLWVDIPGYGQGKLAIAYEIGGPKLAAYTLERDLGIPVDYTVAMTFHGFMNVVNAMGGVTVNVPHELRDPTYPCLVGYAYCPIDIKAGTQHMDGATALEFVRERHAFAQQDLARVQDQQAFSVAVKHALISPSTWLRYPAILKAVQSSVISNMPMNDVPAIGAQYLLTPKSQVDHEYINLTNGLVKPGWSNDGQSILIPSNTTAIPSLVHRLFGDPQLAQEHTPVAVLNGTTGSGVAADVETTLQGMGFHTVAAANAASSPAQCQVIVNTAATGPAEYTARRLQRLFNAQLLHQSLPGQARIVLIVGRSFPTA
jgi:LCP family protein required for cell wall assembly